MKLELDVKINKNGEDKINEFSVENFLEKHVKSGETNQVEEDKGNIMPKISGKAIGVMSVIVGVNLISDILQIFVRCFKISTQTNVLAVLLVVLLIINELLKTRNKNKDGCQSH
ncbi:hypothetical protein D8803_03220 [Streptococcus oralis]|uniref:Uncharacterized protein n=1 Tax=Streptococcus oralis TaxID=1303 RepID=A0A3R9KC90_STROR|nr:hypothetical protein [Streptococcus oralis]RSJ65378.1 hypothetical protein D8803_03220 [Streptococcus oralis]